MKERFIDEDIHMYLLQRNWPELRKAVADIPAPDLADLLSDMPAGEQILLFSVLPRHLASEVFAELGSDEKDTLLNGMTDDETRQLLADLPPDDRTQLFVELPGQVTQRLINLLGAEDLREARLLLGFPEESVGRLMTPDYIAVRPDWHIRQALDHIRLRGKDVENIGIIYVTDSAWHLLDAFELQRLVLADPEDRVERIMDRTFQSLYADEDREEAVRMMERYDLAAAPVINADGVLLGVVTVDDILEVAREETDEDFQKTAAVTPLRIGYRNSTIWQLFSKRIGWLIILIAVNLVSSSIIAAYGEVLAAVIVLAAFIPLLIGTAGNAGIQSASLIIRGLATGDVAEDQWLPVFLKELAEGLLLGVVTGLAAFLLGYWQGSFQVGLVVGMAMLASVSIANIIGVALPFLLTRARLDPAVASSPLITTLVDALGLLIYFSIATWLVL